MNARPYSVVRDVLCLALNEVQRNLLSRPDDPELIKLRASVQRRIALLDGWGATHETDEVASSFDESEKDAR